MNFFKLSLLIITIVNLQFLKVSPQQCDCSCGFVAANSTVAQLSCPQIGDIVPLALRIIWDDGSYSDVSVKFVAQSVVGSCCSFINMVWFGRGIVTGGKFFGQLVNATDSYQDNKLECFSCQTKSQIGVSRFSGLSFLEIGLPGEPNWLRCKGTAELLYSPAATSVVQLTTVTYELRYTQCTNCTDAC